MPVSPWRNLGRALEVVVTANPRTALDVGVGNGKWGYLIREYTDVWHGRHGRENWRVRIEGVEAWEPYIHDYQRLIYDRIVIGRIQETMGQLQDKYDLVVASNVIEHMTRSDALQVIHALKEKTRKAFLASIPVGPGWLRASYNSNPYEAHLSEWDREEFRALGASWINVSRTHDNVRYTALVCFLGDEWKLTPPDIPWGFEEA